MNGRDNLDMNIISKDKVIMIMMYNFFSLDTNQFFLIASQEIFEGI